MKKNQTQKNISKTDSNIILSLVIPIYNEAQHLDDWCQMLFSFKFPWPVEFIFIDDASTDDSKNILANYQNKLNVKMFFQTKNQGKGAALALGLKKTTGKVVIVQDADFEYNVPDIPSIVEPILKDEADIVFGSRYKNSQLVHRTFHYAINRFLTLTSNFCSGLYLSDMETCYKAFRGDIIRNIKIESPRFGFEPEITAKIAALKARVAEVPISYSPRSYLEGKKIRWTDGVAALWHIVKFNFDHENLKDAVKEVPKKYKIDSKQWL